MGLALCVALYGLAVWAPGMLFDSGDAPTAFSWLAATASISHAIGLAVFGFSGLTTRARLMPAVLSALSCAWWVAAFAACPACPAVLAAGAALVSGLAGAASLMSWVERLARAEARIRHATLAAGAALAAALSLILVIPLPARRVCTVALLLGQAALLARRRDEAGASGQARQADEATSHAPFGDHAPTYSPRVLAARLAPVVVSAVVVTFAAPLVNGVLMLDALPMASRSAISACMGLACALVLALAWLVPARPASVQSMLLAFTAVLFAAFLVNWASGLRLSLAVLALGSAGFFFVLYLLIEACLAACAQEGAPVGRVFGAAGCLAMLARVVADEVSLRILRAGLGEDVKTLIAMFLMVYLLTCAGFALYHALSRTRGATGAAGSLADARRAEVETGGGSGEGNVCGDGPSQTALAAAAIPASEPALAVPDPVLARCERVAREHGLSARELEVLVLLMHGRNVPAIAEQLCISKNTVQTHVRHIYEALGVHGRQELLTLVNEAQ